jgi:superfamily II RNA helicase
MKTPREIVEKYIEAVEKVKMSANKKRKECEREILVIEDNYKSIQNDMMVVKKLNHKLKEIEKEKQGYENTSGYLKNNVHVLAKFLEKEGYLTKDESCDDGVENLKMTELGRIASHLREVHCLIFARLIQNGTLNELSTLQMIKLFSCFTNINVDDSVKTIRPYSDVKTILEKIEEDMLYYQDFETNYRINTGVDYTIHYDILKAVEHWVDCNSAQECKTMLQHLENEKGIFLGEFIKAILKINNISNEMEKIVESIGNMELLQKLKQIPEMILKFVATTQSLYV